MKNIYVSFIEEAVMNPQYSGYIGGRVEVSYPQDHFPSIEIRFLTKRAKEFRSFRDTWDMKRISRNEFRMLKEVIGRKFMAR